MTCLHPNMCQFKERCATNLEYSETPVFPVYKFGRCINFVETVKKASKNILTPTVPDSVGDEGAPLPEVRAPVKRGKGAQLQPHKGKRDGRVAVSKRARKH
jgi:hypothetical protein